MNAGPSLASATGTVGPFLVAKLAAFGAKLREIGPRILSSGDAEAVHDLRVALRRTRTLLEVGRPVFGRFHAGEVRIALKEVQQASGALRDEEVLIEILSSLPVDEPDVRNWIEARRRRERRLRTVLRRKLREGQLDRALKLLDALLAFRVKPARDKRLTKFARRAVDDARRHVDRRRQYASDDPENLHRLRIAYKRLRYTAEALASALPLDLGGIPQAAARYQNQLGRLHDVDIAIESVQRAPGLLDSSRAACLAALERIRNEYASTFERERALSSASSRAERPSASSRTERSNASPRTQRAWIAPQTTDQAVGAASLRKTSTR